MLHQFAEFSLINNSQNDSSNINSDKSDIKSIIYENKLPLSLENCKIKITYKFLSHIFSDINVVENPPSSQIT